MTAKTSTSILMELCAQQKASAPVFEEVNEDQPKTFCWIVHAFDLLAKGTGRSKAEAKHAASQALLDHLEQIKPNQFALNNSLSSQSLQNNNAVGSLITLCQHRKLLTPKFYEMGRNKMDQFIYGCRISEHQTAGKGSTKKEAKQNAAAEMLKVIEKLIQSTNSILDAPLQQGDVEANIPAQKVETIMKVPILPILELPSVEETLAEYRRMKNGAPPTISDSIRNRTKFFLNQQNSAKAKEILLDHSIYLTARERVTRVFGAMNLEFEIQSGPKGTGLLLFMLRDCSHDCVIAGETEDKLFEKVIDFLRTMLNVQ